LDWVGANEPNWLRGVVVVADVYKNAGMDAGIAG
jgi:hypothetical protein